MFIYFLYVSKYKYIKQKKNTGHSSGTVVKVFLNSFKWSNSLLLKKNKQTNKTFWIVFEIDKSIVIIISQNNECSYKVCLSRRSTLFLLGK